MMQPQEPPSDEQIAPSADQAEAAPDSPEETTQNPPWWRRLWRGHTEAGAESTEGGQPPHSGEPATETFTLTREELEKRVDAETQRREAKRAAQANSERRRKLRDEDPWQYAEEERNAEQLALGDQQVSTLFAQIGAEHDKYSLDPLVQALPQAERDRILKLEGAGQGLDGRKLIVTKSLEALEKHWKAEGARDAETKLRRNPAFRKQVLSEFRPGMTEPEFVGSGAPSAADQTVSDLLRQSLGNHRAL